MKENKKTIQILAVVTLLIAVVCISVGFALMSTQLSITGSAKIIPANWSVHYVTYDDSVTPAVGGYTFSNNSTTACEAHASGCLPDGETPPPAPTLTTTAFGNYQVILKKPGDKGTYTFDITNDGDIPAKVSSTNGISNADISDPTTNLIITGSGDTAAADVTKVTPYITYKVVWDSDGSAITTTDTLAVNQTRKVRVEVEYLSTATELPTNPVTIKGRNVIITFEQA